MITVICRTTRSKQAKYLTVPLDINSERILESRCQNLGKVGADLHSIQISGRDRRLRTLRPALSSESGRKGFGQPIAAGASYLSEDQCCGSLRAERRGLETDFVSRVSGRDQRPMRGRMWMAASGLSWSLESGVIFCANDQGAI